MTDNISSIGNSKLLEQIDVSVENEVKNEENLKDTEIVTKKIVSEFIDDVINNAKEKVSKINSSEEFNSEVNKLSTSVSPQVLINDDNQQKIKHFGKLPKGLQELTNSVLDIAEEFNDAKTTNEKLALCEKFNSVVASIDKALASGNISDELAEIIVPILFEAIDKVSDIEESIRDFDNFAKKVTEINGSNATSSEKLAQLQNLKKECDNNASISGFNYGSRIEMLRNSASVLASENIVHEDFSKDLNLNPVDQYKFEISATKIISALMLDMSTSNVKSLKNNISEIFNVFKKNNKDLVKANNNNLNALKHEFVKQMIGIASATNTKEICELTDKLLNNSSSALSRDIKEALCHPDDYEYVDAQHTYQSALHNLLKSLPASDQENFKGATSLNKTIVDKLLSSNKADDEIFKEIKYQLASMLYLQHNLVTNKILDIGMDEQQSFNMCCQLAHKLNPEMDFLSLTKIPSNLDGVDLTNLQNLSNQVLENVKALATRFDEGYVAGAKQEQKYINIVKSSANKLTNGISSNRDVKAIYDTDHNIKSLRVFDVILKQLSGELDVEKRGILVDNNSINNKLEKGSDLFKKIENGIKRSLMVHSRLLDKTNDKEAVKIMNSLISNNQKLATKENEDLLKVLDSKMKENEIVYNQSLLKLKGLRREFARCYNVNEKFAAQNQECIKIHDEKKAKNAEYKKMLNVYNQLTWQWPHNHSLRKANANMVMEMTHLNDSIDVLNKQIEEYQNVLTVENAKPEDINNAKHAIVAIGKQVKVLQQELNQKFDAIKNLDLKDLTSRISKKDVESGKKTLPQDVKSFLKDAQPLASALIYFKDGQSKKDLEEIKSLKKQRNEIRKELNNYLDLGKKAFGKETVTQLQRAIMLATYISSKDELDGCAKANTVEGREKIASILSEKMGIKTDNSFISALIDDTIRRYANPKGNIDEKYLALIEDRLGVESTIVSDTEYFMDSDHLDALDSKAMSLYKKRGTQALLDYVSKPGMHFTYNRKDGITVGSKAVLLNVGISGKRDESITVVNNGSGYTVQLKSNKCAELAAKLGLSLAKDISGGVAANISYDSLSGLQLYFKDSKGLDEFLKDFMDSKSKFQTGANDYTPSWIGKCASSTISGSKFDVGGSVSVDLNLAMIKPMKTYKYPTTTVRFAMPEVRASVGGHVQYATVSTEKGDVTLSTSKCQTQLIVEGKITPPKISITNNAYANKKLELGVNVGVNVVQKFSKQLSPFVFPILNSIGETIQSKAGKNFFLDFGKETANLAKDPEKTFSEILLNAAKSAFEKNKSELYKEFLNDFVKQDTNDKGVEFAQFGIETYLNYLALKKGADFSQKMGLGPNYANMTLGVDALDLFAPGFSILANSLFNKPKDANEELAFMKRFVSALKGSAVYAQNGLKIVSSVDSILSGDQISGLSTLSEMISNLTGKITKEHKGDLATVKAEIGGKDILKVEGATRTTHTQLEGNVGLTSGISGKATFGTIVETEFVKAVNNTTKQYTADTSINQTVAIAQFSLENALSTLDVPEEFLEKYKNDEKFRESLQTVFENTKPTDNISVEYKIKADKLKEINELEKRKELDSKNASDYDDKITEILKDRNNYNMISLSIDISKTKDMNTPVDLYRNLNLGVISFEYNRSLSTGFTHTFDMETLSEKVIDKSINKEVKPSFAMNSEQKRVVVDLQKNQHRMQTSGSKTCFMMCVVNALSQTDEGVQKLKNIITPQGVIVTKKNANPNHNVINLDEREVNNRVFVPIVQSNNRNSGSFSPLEEALTKAYQNYIPTHKRGAMGDSFDFATRVFGLEFNGGFEFKEPKKEGEKVDTHFSQIKDSLDQGCIAILHKGNELHYVAITKAREVNGRQLVTIADSMTNSSKEVEISDIVKNGNTLQLLKVKN